MLFFHSKLYCFKFLITSLQFTLLKFEEILILHPKVSNFKSMKLCHFKLRWHLMDTLRTYPNFETLRKKI